MDFQLKAPYRPAGGQPAAIRALTDSLKKKNRFQTLLGVTGSGKTFTVANLIQKIQRPTLVIAHNKTLAAQLTQEFRDFFPNNAVEYFVSYYDYYQPEAYIPASDTYIEKEADINEEIERMRNAATASLLTRNDVIIVASVSCIYGLGDPTTYRDYTLHLSLGQQIERDALIEKLVDIGYTRSEYFESGTFSARGNKIDVVSPFKPAFYRLRLDDHIEEIEEYDVKTRSSAKKHQNIDIFPTRHFVVSPITIEEASKEILAEMRRRVSFFLKKKLYLEAERLERRVTQDMAMLRQVGYVGGIENYSRYLTGRSPGEPPYTLIDYFPRDFLTVIDESHVTIPQIRGMHEGDRSRKVNLIKYGFRLPSALDNRPLTFDEFLAKTGQMVFTSATPAEFEKINSKAVVEQIIRPTGLVDPELIVKSSKNQIADVIEEIERVHKNDRVLITALTKKMAEELSDYLKERSIKSCYIHSDVETLDRIKILADLRKGKYRVLVGVNLLREGLDLPEVSLIAILDADKEGFLRNEVSLIQTIGRAARNVRGRVILYGERMTGSMKSAIKETGRRRNLQLAYNKRHGITPQSISKKISSLQRLAEKPPQVASEYYRISELADLKTQIREREEEMKTAADNLEFEKAALIRDELAILKKLAK